MAETRLGRVGFDPQGRGKPGGSLSGEDTGRGWPWVEVRALNRPWRLEGLMEEERLFVARGLSFWAHRMRGLVFKCPRIVGNMGLKGDGSRVSGVCVHVCVCVCARACMCRSMLASFLEHTSSFLLRTFSRVIFSPWQALFLPLLPCGSLCFTERPVTSCQSPVTVTPAGTPDTHQHAPLAQEEMGGGGA